MMKKEGISSSIPRYQQVIELIVAKVQDHILRPGDALPSLNQTATNFQISRDTALAAYKVLKEKGLVKAIPGKGYFLTGNSTKSFLNVFVLFDELNPFKEDLYNAFVAALGKEARIDIYFHHFNRTTFNQLVAASAGNYSHYVIMPTQFENVTETLKVLPAHRTFILDQSNADLDANYSSVYQNFETDVYNALHSAGALLNKYEKFIMIHPGGKEPEGQKTGFLNYCRTLNKPHELLKSLGERKLQKQELYITPNDRCLVTLVKQLRELGWQLGKDIGIISYNDTPLKEVVAKGITTISTDFKKMGENLAQLIKGNLKQNIKNPSALIVRNSI